MKSFGLLPDLEKLPGKVRHRSFREAIKDLHANESALVASEIVAAASFAMWGIWDQVNVPDSLTQAYGAQYPGRAAERSLYEHWQQVQADGPGEGTGFISGLKGKLAEINAVEMLESNGYSNVSIASSPVQDGWDISAVNEAGEPVRFQVKTGAEGYADAVATDMADAENIEFLVSSELYTKISESNADFTDRMTDIGPDYVLVDGIQDGLETLSGNQGIDLVDSVGEVIPGLAMGVVSARLGLSFCKTEREFTEVNRPTRNRIHVRRGVPLLAWLVILIVLSLVGAVVGSVVPVVGSFLGGILGLVVGIVVYRQAKKRLQPYARILAEQVSGVTDDDLFCFRYKRRIDELAMTFRERADGLTA